MGADIRLGMTIISQSPILTAILRAPRHSRESGNPEGLAIVKTGVADAVSAPRPLGRADAMNLTQWRKGREDAIVAPLFPIFTPSFPRKRESSGLGTAFAYRPIPLYSDFYSREI